MASVTLTASEFDTFVAVTEYLLASKYPNEEKVLKRGELYYKRIGEWFGYGWRYINNWYTVGGKCKAVDSYFNRFCKAFETEMTKIQVDDPETKTKYFVAFKDWVTEICRRKNWKNPLTPFMPVHSQNLLPSPTGIVNQLPMLSEREQVHSMVHTFYSAIGDKEFKVAWSCLSGSVKNGDWDNNYGDFRKQTADSDLLKFEIKDVFKIHDGIYECQVVCIFHEMNGLVDLAFLNEIAMENKLGVLLEKYPRTIKFVRAVQKANNLIENTTPSGDQSILFKDVIRYMAADNGHDLQFFQGRRNCNKAVHVFGPDMKITIREVLHHNLCVCKFSGENWEIDNIRNYNLTDQDQI